jgi:hypothetical protein
MSTFSHENHYTLLQLDPSAEPEVIESAFRRLARKHHPDLNKSPEASERMRRLNEAYATLINPARRAVYDREVGLAARMRGSTVRAPPSTVARSRDRDAASRLCDYQAAIEPLKAVIAKSMRSWSAEWSHSLDALLAGDGRGRQRLDETGQRSLSELADCLARWEALVPPSAAHRLSDLGAACLKLQIALVRGTMTFGQDGDFALLEPLAGLAERISGLTRTVASEELRISS